MKLSIVNALVFAASVSAIRVVVVPSTDAAPSNSDPVAAIVRPPTAAQASAVRKNAPCGGIRGKMSSLSESFRIALGFSSAKEGDKHFGMLSKTPGGDWVKVVSVVHAEGEVKPHPHPHPHHHHHHEEGRIHRHGHGRFRHGGEQPSFLMRVHFALMSLGPWEGRAVAFVLGCGIGVLLRMFWVLTVLSFRALKGAREDNADTDFYYAALPADAEDIFVAAPQYTVVVESVPEYPVEKQEAPVPMPIPVPAPVENN